MTIPNKSTQLALSALGIIAVGASVLPMLPILRGTPTEYARKYAEPLLHENVFNPDLKIVKLDVDLQDNLSASDIAAFDKQYGVDLKDNSTATTGDNLMSTTMEHGKAEELLAKIKNDPRVEAAEEDITYTLPEAENAVKDVAGSTIVEVTSEDGKTLTTSFENAPSGSIMLPATEKMYIRGPHVDHEIATGMDDTNTAPNDPRYNEQWNFKMIGAEDAWKKTKGKGAIVAVIDTGVTVPGSTKGLVAEDLELTKFVPGYDFVNKADEAYDDHGHGTHVAGTIAQSTNNNTGVAGIAYEASIMPLKVLSASGSGSSADIADAIRWAADHGANVINMSLGSMYPSSVMEKACQYARKKNVTIVCAAGNGFGPPVGYPAAFKECIAVSAVGPDGEIATYSSYGKQVTLAAPGGDVLKSGDKKDGILQSTVLEGKPGYYSFNGTSMASPHVAAAAALLVSQGVKDPAKIQDILQKSAVSKGTSTDAKEKYGAGILNIAKATARAEGLEGTRMRHFLWPALAFLLLAMGGMRRSLGLRMAMAGAMGVGFFAPELFSNAVGYDSAWNLIGFSAMAPALVTALLWRGRGVKIASAYAIGTAFCLFAGYHNANLPFTANTFGTTALPFVFTNIVAGFGISILGGLKAIQRNRIAE